MIIFALTFLILLVVVAIMSVGVMAGRKPIAGSCGGLQNLGVGATCEFCGGDSRKCESRQQKSGLEDTTVADTTDASTEPCYYDATKP